MTMFKRIISVIKAWIHKILDRVEDPEKLLDQAISDMEQNFRRSKVELARIVADERRLKLQLDQNEQQAQQWGAKAVLAVKSGEDDLAREALKRKNSYDALVTEMQTQWKTQKDITDQLRDSLKSLESKIEEAQRKRNILVSRQQRALLQKKLNESLRQTSLSDPSSTLSKLEAKISDLEAESLALENLETDSLESKFRALESGNDVEHQLEELKRKYLE